MPARTLTVKNFRGLREATWEIPEGMSALVGPNGSGKSTLLAALEFLRVVLIDDFARAVQASGGRLGLRHFDAAPDAFVEFVLEVGELRWELRIPFNGPNPDAAFGEKLVRDGRTLVEFDPFATKGTVEGRAFDRKPGSSRLSYMLRNPGEGSAPTDAGLALDLELTITYSRWHTPSYDIAFLRTSGSIVDGSTVLSANGRSLWSVLRNWRDKRETRPRYDFVLAAMSEAFPQQFADLDFESTAQQVVAQVYVPGSTSTIPHHLFSDGWFTGIIHLCAVASASPGNVVAIDEAENSLHPHAIRSLLRHIGTWADQHHLSVVFATHSPVVLNQFRDRARVFVTEAGHGRFPVPLDAHPNHEWLSHFSIGDAYANEEVGAPKPVT